jgi:hypothetical protein
MEQTSTVLPIALANKPENVGLADRQAGGWMLETDGGSDGGMLLTRTVPCWAGKTDRCSGAMDMIITNSLNGKPTSSYCYPWYPPSMVPPYASTMYSEAPFIGAIVV